MIQDSEGLATPASASSQALPTPSSIDTKGLSIAQRLPRLEPWQTILLNEFASVPRRTDTAIDDQRVHWRLLLTAPARPQLWLSDGDALLGLRIDQDGYCDDIGDIPWQDYRGPSRRLAWTVAHESLLQHLSLLFGTEWMPLPEDDSSAPCQLATQTLAWALQSEQGQAVGTMVVSFDSLPGLLRNNRWQVAPSPCSNPAWQHIHLKMSLELTTTPFSYAELQEFTPGDLMLIDARVVCERQLRLVCSNAGMVWPLKRCTDGWQITGNALPLPNDVAPPQEKEGRMQDMEVSMQDMGNQDQDALQQSPLTGLDRVPVDVSFQLARLNFSLGELSKLQPGFVFSLAPHLESAQVSILANGQYLGRGELIAIGDALGVRLTEFDAHGV